MARTYTVASYTKNFSWNHSYKTLHSAIRNGFAESLVPVTRDKWRSRSRIADADRQLIPMNFFLYSMLGLNEDFLMVDRLVERACAHPYGKDFARLGLFAFHVANSGSWRRSKWPNGRVAGWANDHIREFAWRNGAWMSAAFEERALEKFIEERIKGEPVTKRKVLTNYLYMLESAGVLVDGELQEPEFNAPWPVDATMLFWDRQIFDRNLRPSSGFKVFEELFFEHEIHKLLGTTEKQGRAFAMAAYRDYSGKAREDRFSQLQNLERLLSRAA
jgi:hypothetical protein